MQLDSELTNVNFAICFRLLWKKLSIFFIEAPVCISHSFHFLPSSHKGTQYSKDGVQPYELLFPKMRPWEDLHIAEPKVLQSGQGRAIKEKNY